jgi:peptidyl-prolyl cis-trans isomerase C
MHKTSRLLALLIAGAITASPALAADKKAASTEKPVAVVNGQPIPAYLGEALATEAKSQGAKDSPELQAAVRDNLVRLELFSLEAKKKGMDKAPLTRGAIELTTRKILAQAYIADYLKAHPVSDADIKKEYEAIKPQLGGTEYHARHILVDSEDQAKAIIAKLDKGEKFADLAKESKDPGSKDKGGDLGWANPAGFVPEFGQALTKLEKGKYTKTPVKTQFGYHVIALDDTRPVTPPSYEQMKPQISQHLTQVQIEKLSEELRAKAKIE